MNGPILDYLSSLNYKFNVDFMKNLLDKTKQERKRAILTGHFNLNLINKTQKAGTNQGSETVQSNKPNQ